MKLISDEDIYRELTYGFAKEVKTDNFTDEIELKRHEAAKQVAQAQLESCEEQEQEKVRGMIKYLKIRWLSYESNPFNGKSRHTFALPEDWEEALKEKYLNGQ